MCASTLCGGRSLSQSSQFGRISSNGSSLRKLTLPGQQREFMSTRPSAVFRQFWAFPESASPQRLAGYAPVSPLRRGFLYFIALCWRASQPTDAQNPSTLRSLIPHCLESRDIILENFTSGAVVPARGAVRLPLASTALDSRTWRRARLYPDVP